MRALALLAMAMATSSGCRFDNGAVLFHLDQKSDDFFGPLTYSSSEAAVSFAADGHVFFGASSSQGTVRVQLDSPLVFNATVALPAGETDVQYQLGNGEWGNDGGSVFVISVDPAIIRLLAVPMSPRSGVATGTFTFDGDGTFR